MTRGVQIYREPIFRITEHGKARRLTAEHNAVCPHFASGKVDGQIGKLIVAIQPRSVSRSILAWTFEISTA